VPPPSEQLGVGGLSANVRALRLMVRNELFRWVELLSRGAYDELAAREGSSDWSERRLAEALAPYWDEHDTIGIDASARSGGLFRLDESSMPWTATQVLDDPAANHDWILRTHVDPDATDEQGRAVLVLDELTRLT
jgi:hypothetical protein